MALESPVQHRPKTLGESAVCFACMAGLILTAAFGFQFLLHLLP